MSMKKLPLFLMASLLILSLASCGKKNASGIHDSKTLYLEWKKFNEKKDADSCRSFIAELEKFEPESFDAYPELHAQTNE